MSQGHKFAFSLLFIVFLPKKNTSMLIVLQGSVVNTTYKLVFFMGSMFDKLPIIL